MKHLLKWFKKERSVGVAVSAPVPTVTVLYKF